jgi:hypothetical protein
VRFEGDRIYGPMNFLRFVTIDCQQIVLRAANGVLRYQSTITKTLTSELTGRREIFALRA